MAFDTNGSPLVMPVAPTGFGGGFGGGFGNGLDGDAWLILIILFALFGNGFGGWGGGFGGMGGFAADGAMLYPWMNQAEITQNGFRDQMINSSIQGIQNSVTSGFGDVQLGIAGVNQNICQTGNSIVSAVNGAQNAITAQMYGNQIADMERSYASQTATMQGFNGLQSQIASCCCDNRLATANLSSDLAREACATRTNDTQNTQAILNSVNAGIQSIKDQLCADKIDQKNDTIAQLRSELLYARGQASQDVQTAQILAGQVREIDGVYQRLKDCPIGTTPVYGNTPIFSCPQTINSCGCGCGNLYA